LEAAPVELATPSPQKHHPNHRHRRWPAPAIRAYLAEHFLYESWYPSIRSVTVHADTATVDATTGPAAGAICRAVLASADVSVVRVQVDASTQGTCFVQTEFAK